MRVTTTPGESEEVHLRPTAKALLAYLLLFRRRCHRREVLVETFWRERDEESGRHSLSTTLWRLRRILESDRGDFLVAGSTDEIGFAAQCEYWLDIAEFEQNIQEPLRRPRKQLNAADAQQLEAACNLYLGDLLEGFYDDWVITERERLRLLHIRCLNRLMQYHTDRLH